MRNKPRLLVVIADASLSGAPRQVALALPELTDTWEVHLLCPVGWLATNLAETDVVVHVVKNSHRGAALVKELIQEIQPDVVHAHGPRGGNWCIPGLKKNTIPFIYTEHLWTLHYHLRNPLREMVQMMGLRRICHRASVVVAVSDSVADFFSKRKIAQSNKITVVHGAINQSWLPPKPENPLQVGTLGRLTPTKGVDVLLRALKRVLATCPETLLIIGGEGPETDKLQDLARDLSIAKNCRWIGYQPDAAAVFQPLSVYVQPSRSEAFGLASLEAMAAGIPTVLTDACGLARLAKNERDALIVPSENPEKLAQAIIRILQDTTLQNTLRTNGHALAAQFSPRAMAEAYLKIYASLVA